MSLQSYAAPLASITDPPIPSTTAAIAPAPRDFVGGPPPALAFARSCYDGAVNFAARLVPHRSTWDVVRLTWGPFFAVVALVLLGEALEGAAPAAAKACALLAGPAFMVGTLVVTFMWRRGPKLTVADGALVLAARRVPVGDVQARVSQHVFKVQTRFASGTCWLPLLSLRFPDGGEVRIVRPDGGGPARGRRPTRAPNYSLEPGRWDELAALFGAGEG
jgi:hypothetical protein